MSDTKSCLHCGSKDLEIVDKHPGTVRDDSQRTVLDFHHIYKCNNCGSKSSDCDRFLRVLIPAIIEDIDVKVLDKTLCDYIENNYIFVLARILYFIREGQYEKAIQFANEKESFIKNLDSEKKNLYINFLLIKAFLFYKLRDLKNIHEVLKLLPQNDNIYEKSSLFVYQLFNILINNNSEIYESFKGSWFDNFNIPFEIIEMPDDYDAHLSFIDENISILLSLKGFFEEIVISLFEDVTRISIKWDIIPNDNITFLDYIVKKIYSIEKEYRPYYFEENAKRVSENFIKKVKKQLRIAGEDDDEVINELKPYKSYSNVQWYKNIKRFKDQLSFRLYMINEKYDKAFHYYENEGVNHILYKDNIGYDHIDSEDEYFEVSPKLFPIYYDPKTWLPHGDMHDITYLSYYSEVWGEVLKYLTIVHLYENEINKHDKQTQELIKDRILFVTNQFMKDLFLERELFRRRVPNIVPKIYEERNDWEKALEMWKMAHTGEDEKRKVLERYKIDGALFNSVQNLKKDEQRQIILYVKLIIQLEPQLRKFIRRIFKLQGVHTEEIIGKYFPEVDNRIKREGGKLLTHNPDIRQDKLDWLTLPELFTLITHRDFNLYRILGINKDQILTAKTVLSPIRNYIAHAVPVTDTDIDITVKYVDKILDAMNKIKVK